VSSNHSEPAIQQSPSNGTEFSPLIGCGSRDRGLPYYGQQQSFVLPTPLPGPPATAWPTGNFLNRPIWRGSQQQANSDMTNSCFAMQGHQPTIASVHPSQMLLGNVLLSPSFSYHPSTRPMALHYTPSWPTPRTIMPQDLTWATAPPLFPYVPPHGHIGTGFFGPTFQ
jgi:hypothetical protein